jgi:hypothetical protein
MHLALIYKVKLVFLLSEIIAVYFQNRKISIKYSTQVTCEVFEMTIQVVHIVTIWGVWLDMGFRLYSILGLFTTFGPIANLHSLHFTTAPLSIFKPAVFSTAVPWRRLLTVEILQLPVLRFSYHSRPCRITVNCQFFLVSPAELDCTAKPQLTQLCAIWGFQSGDYEECRLLGCSAV